MKKITLIMLLLIMVIYVSGCSTPDIDRNETFAAQKEGVEPTGNKYIFIQPHAPPEYSLANYSK